MDTEGWRIYKNKYKVVNFGHNIKRTQCNYTFYVKKLNIVHTVSKTKSDLDARCLSLFSLNVKYGSFLKCIRNAIYCEFLK